MVPSAPDVSRAVGFSGGARITAVTVDGAKNGGDVVEGLGRGIGVRCNEAPADNSRVFKSGGGAGFGASTGRTIIDQSPARRASDAGQAIGARKTRDRKSGCRRHTSTDFVGGPTAGAESSGSTKGVAARGKVDGCKTQARRVGSHVSFATSITEGSGGGEDDPGGVAENKKGRIENGTADQTFRMQAGQSNTLVAVRLRPLLKHDREHVEVAKVKSVMKKSFVASALSGGQGAQILIYLFCCTFTCT